MTSQQLLGSRYRTDSIVAGRYEVRSALGQGGMAEVYSAFDRTLGRMVALKVLRDALAADPRAVARFRREARAVAALTHPNIVAIYDVGMDGPTPFMVTELVAGEPLSTVIWREAPLAVDRAVNIGLAVAEALAFAHDSGIVHRDVKPANVMVTASGHVKVLDFGIARAAHWTPLTEGGSLQGTAEYVSPEQARGLYLDGRSDVYSLGVVLYEMLAGLPPFRGDTDVAVAFQHLEQQPPPLRLARPDTPAAVEAIVTRCLAKKPRDRYQDAATLARDLRKIGAPAPASIPAPVARRPVEPETPPLPAEAGPSRELRTIARTRKRTKLWALVAVMVLAVAGGGAFFLLRESPLARASIPRPPVLHGPTALTAKAGCKGLLKAKVALAWLPSSSRFADGYVVYRSTSPDGPFEKVELLPGRFTTSFVDAGLGTGSTYYYRVQATAGIRISASAPQARAETPFLCF
jgi:serine/threonine-protein kinase